MKTQPSSRNPGKQRKWKAIAPLHRRQKMLSSPLSKELRQKYKRRRLNVRKGDKVRVMVGDFKGNVGEIIRVNLKNYKLYIDGITIKKADGTDVERAMDPSNVMIIDLFMDDKERTDVLERNME